LRLYSVAIAALAIGSSQKWLDNVLSHFTVWGVATEKRGVSRRIPHRALLQLALARELHVELAVGVRDALSLADELLLADGGAVSRGGHLRVTLNRGTLEREVTERLQDALESAPTPRRGRPARSAPATSA
jgi:hypothetical protein